MHWRGKRICVVWSRRIVGKWCNGTCNGDIKHGMMIDCGLWLTMASVKGTLGLARIRLAVGRINCYSIRTNKLPTLVNLLILPYILFNFQPAVSPYSACGGLCYAVFVISVLVMCYDVWTWCCVVMVLCCYGDLWLCAIVVLCSSQPITTALVTP